MISKIYRAFLFCRHARLRDVIALPPTDLEHIMDLNYLYQRYGISLQLSEAAACGPSRIAHRKMAEAYAARIELAKINGTEVTA